MLALLLLISICLPLSAKTELEADAVFNTDFSSGGDIHRSFLDYRAEGRYEFYEHNGSSAAVISRIQGIAPFDSRMGDFFDDQLIDIPELFYEQTIAWKKYKSNLRFGKFATRRFFNKDEVFSDPFDMGEMRFSGAIGHSLNLLNRINEFRDDDHRDYGTRQATGSYGFAFDIDKEQGLLKGLEFSQAFLQAELDDYWQNFYAVSELSYLKNLDKNPSQYILGFLYANEDVFRIPDSQLNSQLLYASYSKEIDEFKYYLKYGALFFNQAGIDASQHEYRTGVSYKLSELNSISSWLGLFDGSRSLGQNDASLTWTNIFSHELSSHLRFLAAFSQSFARFNASKASQVEPYEYTLAVHLQFVL